jgi:hypothetical protein
MASGDDTTRPRHQGKKISFVNHTDKRTVEKIQMAHLLAPFFAFFNIVQQLCNW